MTTIIFKMSVLKEESIVMAVKKKEKKNCIKHKLGMGGN